MAEIETPFTGTLNNNESLPRPGDIELEKLEIINYNQSEKHDIRYLCKEFNIYEAVGQDHIRADLVFDDSLSLVSQLPIIGEELVNIRFRTPAVLPDNETDTSGGSSQYDWIDMSFQVAKMEFVRTTNIRNELVKLILIPAIKFTDMAVTVQKAYGPELISEMVEKIGKDYLDLEKFEVSSGKAPNENNQFEIEETVGQHQFVIPNMTPFETMHFLAGEAKGANTSQEISNFIFFQDHQQYNFITLEKLVSQNAVRRYYVTEQNLNTNIPIDPQNNLASENSADFDCQPKIKNPAEFHTMYELIFKKIFDFERDRLGGMYDNQTYYIDPVTQQYEATTLDAQGVRPYYNYDLDFDKFKHTGCFGIGFQTISDESSIKTAQGPAHVRYMITNKGQNAKTHQAYPRVRQDILPLRVASMKKLDSIVFELTVPGDSDIKAGDNIMFDLHEIGATDDIIDELHKYLKGKFFVTAIRHKYTYNIGYHTTIECVKNVFETEVKNEALEGFPGSGDTSNPTDTSKSSSGVNS